MNKISITFYGDTINELAAAAAHFAHSNGVTLATEKIDSVASTDSESVKTIKKDQPKVDQKTSTNGKLTEEQIELKRVELRAILRVKNEAGFKDQTRAALDACGNAKSITLLDPQYFDQFKTALEAIN